MRNQLCKFSILICGLLATGCAAAPVPRTATVSPVGPRNEGSSLTAPAPQTATISPVGPRNEGYSLLYNLISDESRVGEVFILKSAPAPVTSTVKEIGQFCKETKARMDQFAKADPHLNYTVSDLPPMEQQSRDLQKSDDTHALLFSSGQDFERRLIFTQAEAMNYAVQLAKALAPHENDPARKSFLLELARRGGQFHDRLMSLFAVTP